MTTPTPTGSPPDHQDPTPPPEPAFGPDEEGELPIDEDAPADDAAWTGGTPMPPD